MQDLIHERIEFHARLNPSAIAFHEGGHDIRYGRLRSDVNAVAARLVTEAGLGKGDRVLVAVAAPYLEWLVILACARLGIATVSVNDPADMALPGASACISDVQQPDLPPGVRRIEVSRDWIPAKPGASAANPPWPSPHEDDLARIVLSSGTTGRSKMIAITYGQLRDRVLYAAGTYEFTSRTRCLVAVGTASLGGFQLPVATWYSGGAVVAGGAGNLLANWRDGHPTFMMLAPGVANELLRLSPPAMRPDPALTVIIAGAQLPDALNIDLRLRVAANMYNVYGSSECSTVSMCHAADCLRRPGYVGHPPPYVGVQVVDEEHRVLPAGEEGALRTRGPGMAAGYVDDPQASAQAFRDGWFYPGDAARMNADGSIVITGRISEIANIGGVKIAPERIDEIVARVPGVREAAAFGLPGDAGTTLWIAVVAGDFFDEAALLARYREAFPKHPAPHVLRVDAIPRSEMGKVQRARLIELARAKQAVR